MEARKKKVFSNFIWRLAERCGAQIVTLVVSIVLARLLDPVVYGTVALVTVITTILQVFVDSGMGNALIQKKNADILDFSTVFFFNIVLCIVLYTILFFCAPLIAEFYGMSDLTPVIRVLGTIIIISGVKNVQQAYVSKHLLFKRFFWATLGGTITAAGVGIGMAYAGYGVWALVAQYLVNATMDTIILWITVKFRPKFVFSFKRLKGLFSFGWKLLVSSLLDTGYKELRSLIIGKKYSSEDLAYYNQGNKYPGYVATNVNSAIDSVLLPVMSEEQDNRQRVKEMTRRAIKTSSFILWPLMMGIAACAEPIVSLLLTDKWLPCVLYLRIFCITYAFYPIHTANLNAIKAMGRSDLFLILEIIKKALGLALIFGFMWISVEAMAWSCILSSVCGQIINSWPNKKLLHYKYLEQIKDILPSILLSLVMAAAVYAIHFIGLSDWLTLLIQVPLGMLIYIGGAKLLKFETMDYMLQILKQMKKKKEGEKMPYKGKKLLVLGGASQHCKIVEKAKEMGIETYVTDFLPKAPAKDIADHQYQINVTETEELAKLCETEKIDGIIAGWLDFIQEPYVKLCERTGKYCYGTAEQFEILTQKSIFKEKCIEYSVGHPSVFDYQAYMDCTDVKKLPYEVFVKPSESRGSRGSCVCADSEELKRAIEIAQKESKDGKAIAERYIKDAKMILVVYMFVEGVPYLQQVSDAYFGDKLYGMEKINVVYKSPSKYAQKYIEIADKKMKEMLKGIGLRNGPACFQAFLTEDDVLFYDPGRRFPGGEYERGFKKATKIDMVEKMIEFSLTGVMDKTKEIHDTVYMLNNKHVLRLQVNIQGGTIKSIEGFEKLSQMKEVEYIAYYHSVGDVVENTGDVRQRFAQILYVADTIEELKNALYSTYSLLHVYDVENHDLIVKSFNPEEI